MIRRIVALMLALALGISAALAQQPAAPIPLFSGAPPPRTLELDPEPLPPLAPGPEAQPPSGQDRPVPPNEPPRAAANARVFCEQPVTVHVADRDRVPERYRGFVGMWSDASWTPQLCAALVVENVAPDGTATILYAFGPIGGPKGSGTRTPAGVLNGTGIVRDGELRFQNADGSQFGFRPLYSDLDGRLTTPQGQTYQAIFKKTP